MAVKSIDAKTLKLWLDNNEAILIDVREPGEYEAESIPGAKLIPLGTISQGKLPIHEGRKLVIHCHLGKRGTKACEKLFAENNNLDIYNLEGGLTAWKDQGYPVLSEPSFVLPLDQQVQLTIGSAVLLGSLFTYLFGSWWLLFTGFFGAGLCFAGLTGNCYLAQVMAKMPWNKGTVDCSKL